ncbi:50S ribosomal protein L20 [bacterium]
MTRVKGGVITKKRKKKYFKIAKGYRLGKSNLYKHVKEQVEKSLLYAYRDRRQKKRDFRALWIIRINAAARIYGLSYSKFISGIKKASIEVDRKILADIAVHDQETFGKLAELAKETLGIQ